MVNTDLGSMDGERWGGISGCFRRYLFAERGTYQACHNLCERQRIGAAEDHFMTY